MFEGCGEATDGSFQCYQFDAGRVSKHWAQGQRELKDYTYARGHACVVQSDGRASCQKFDGTDSADLVPQDKRFVDIDTFDTTASCGVTIEGELWCWGETAANTRRVTLPMGAALE